MAGPQLSQQEIADRNNRQAEERKQRALIRKTAGRPSKYKERYCVDIVLAMKDGGNATEFAASIGVSRDTISEWARVHPEFSVALKQAKAASAAWWSKQGRHMTVNGGTAAQANMVRFHMTNMAETDFKDRSYSEFSGPNGGPIPVTNGTPEEYAAALAAALKAV